MKRRLALILALLLAIFNGATLAENLNEIDVLALDATQEQSDALNGLPEIAESEIADLVVDDGLTLQPEDESLTPRAMDALLAIRNLDAVLTARDAEANLAEPNAAPLPIDEKHFPDGHFRKFVGSELDTDADQKLSGDEVKSVLSIDVTGKGISNLEGIGIFKKLETLICQNNRLTGLCLDGCAKLKYLDCSKNRLKTLDVRGCGALTDLVCGDNKLKELNLEKNTALVRLDCRNNKLSTLSLSANKALCALNCTGNRIKKLDIAQMAPKLYKLMRNMDLCGWYNRDLRWQNKSCYVTLSTPVTLSDGDMVIYKKEDFYDYLRISRHRSDFSRLNDASFANFRNIATRGMGRNALYRSSSPLRPIIKRNNEAMAAMSSARVRTVINMAESDSTVKAYATYANSRYSKTSFWAKKTRLGIRSQEFKSDIADICRFIADHKGPYMVHCIYGKDRTGFMCALLECLMGAGSKEIVRDYMKTYDNFYNIKSGSWEYNYIANTIIVKQLKTAFRIRRITGKSVDLSACAENYLRECGLTDKEISKLKKKLATDY